MSKLTRKQAAIVGAYTGFTAGPFQDIHALAEAKLGRPIWTHEFARVELAAELREAVKADYMALCADVSDPEDV